MELSSLILDIIKTLFSPFLKVLKWLYERLPFKVVSRKPPLKLGIIESSWGEHTWEFAKHRDKDVVAIHTHWQITNTLPYNLTALNAFLTKPEGVKGSVMIKSHQSDIFGHYPIPNSEARRITGVSDTLKMSRLLKSWVAKGLLEKMGTGFRGNVYYRKPGTEMPSGIFKKLQK